MATTTVQARYKATPPTLKDGQQVELQVNAEGELKVAANINVGDIQIGAVELKDATTEARLNVATDDAAMPATPTLIPVGGEYRAVPTTYADGDAAVLQTTSKGELKSVEQYAPEAEDNSNKVMAVVERPLAVATYAPDEDLSAAAEASSVSKASAGNLYGFVFNNGNGAARYLQFFNDTSVPADTAVPVLSFYVPAGQTLSLSFNRPRYFSTGICWCTSSTQNTKTIGAADAIASVLYK